MLSNIKRRGRFLQINWDLHTGVIQQANSIFPITPVMDYVWNDLAIPWSRFAVPPEQAIKSDWCPDKCPLPRRNRLLESVVLLSSLHLQTFPTSHKSATIYRSAVTGNMANPIAAINNDHSGLTARYLGIALFLSLGGITFGLDSGGMSGFLAMPS
jgi:hypothetical protein